MDKKAGMISSNILKISLVIIIVLVFSSSLFSMINTSKHSIDQQVGDRLKELERNENNFQQYLKGFEDIRSAGEISDKTISVAEDFLDQLLKESPSSKNKTLLIRNKLDQTDPNTLSFVLKTFKTSSGVDGLMAYFDTTVRKYVLKKPSDHNLNLYGKQLCVLPLDEGSKDAAKFLSYVTQRPLLGGTGLITQEDDLDALISRNKVSFVSFQLSSDEDPKVFYSSEGNIQKQNYVFADEKMWVFKYKDTICFIPLTEQGWKFTSFFKEMFSGTFFNGVTFSSTENLAEAGIGGTGFLDGRLKSLSIEKILDTKKIDVVKN